MGLGPEGRGQGQGNLGTMCDQLLPLAPKGSVSLGQESCVKAFAEVKNTCLTFSVARPEDYYRTGLYFHCIYICIPYVKKQQLTC